MIDKNLPEPPVEVRSCVRCGKRKRLTAILIHWPDDDYDTRHNGSDVVILPYNQTCHSFSMWSYKCAWCKANDTKRKKRWGF